MKNFSLHSFGSTDGVDEVCIYGIDSGHVCVDVFARRGDHEATKRIVLGHGAPSAALISRKIEEAKAQVRLAVMNKSAALDILEGK